MRTRNFTLSGDHFSLIARVSEEGDPVYDLIFDDAALEGLTYDRLRLTLSTMQQEIKEMIDSSIIEEFDRDWSGKVPVSDGNGGYFWGYRCDDKRHAD